MMSTVIVTSRFPTVSALGQNMAYDQDATSCGALLNSRHNGHAGWDCEGEAGNSVGAVPSTFASVVEEQGDPEAGLTPKPLKFQEHFIMHDEAGTLMANVPYWARTGEGRIFEGETDSEGRTAVIWTDSPDAIEVAVGPRTGDDNTDPYHYDEQDYGKQ